MRWTAVLGLAAVLAALATAAAVAEDSAGGGPDRVEALLRQAETAYAGIQSYTCTIRIRERHGGKLRGMETIACRFKKPDSVYLEWGPGPFEGLRVSYVQGRDAEGTFLGREAGLAGMVGVQRYRFAGHFVRTFYPHRYSPSQTNLGHLLDEVAGGFRRAVARGGLRVTIDPDARSPYLAGPMERVDVVLPPDPEGKDPARAVVYFDLANRLPLHVELYDAQGQLYGLYVFADLKPGPVPDEAFVLK